MGALLGSLGLADSENDFVNDVGHALVYDHIGAVLDRYNVEIAHLFDIFVERKTSEDTLRYLKPTGGMSAPISEFVPPAPVGRIGSWDTAFPLRGWGSSLAISKRGLAYTTAQQLDAQLTSLMHKDLARLRKRILIALFENTNLSWLDPHQQNASITVRRLANGAGDSVTYPPVLGSDTEATDDHYSETAGGYAIANIDDTNNPLVTLRDEIIEHFGGRSARGEDLIVFMNKDAETKVRALTDFERVDDKDVRYGADKDFANLLTGVPGRVIGRSNGVWAVVYAYIPATYMLGVHMDFPPLIMRVDTEASGYAPGEYALVAKDENHPLLSSTYERWYGFGVGDRLSAAVIEISGGAGSYTPPAEYAE